MNWPQLQKRARAKMEKEGVSFADLAKYLGLNHRQRAWELLHAVSEPKWETGENLRKWVES